MILILAGSMSPAKKYQYDNHPDMFSLNSNFVLSERR